jgi:hypothetical protein
LFDKYQTRYQNQIYKSVRKYDAPEVDRTGTIFFQSIPKMAHPTERRRRKITGLTGKPSASPHDSGIAGVLDARYLLFCSPDFLAFRIGFK